MRIILIKIFFIVIICFYQSTAYSKTNDKSEFNHKFLSNYFSALISYDNQNNQKALKYFNLSKTLESKNQTYMKKYLFSMVNDGQINKAIKQIKFWKNNKDSDFFEMNILLLVDALNRKDFKKSKIFLSNLKNLKNSNTYETVIYETLKSYFNLFDKKKIDNESEYNFGRLSIITNAFQNCYLDTEKTNSLFLNLMNSPDGDYSRYLFFYLAKKIKEKKYETAKQISSTIDPIANGLLVLQTKYWVDNLDFEKFNKIFSCENEKHLLSEFFFLIANLYSSDEEYDYSNFYLNIANYLNSNFYYNLTLLFENYFIIENYDASRKILNKFGNSDDMYNWYKIKNISKILYIQENEIRSLRFVESKFNKIKNPSAKIIFDMGNIYKRSKKYEKAIEFYTKAMEQLDQMSASYADILYRRGGSYERIKKYKLSDIDLINSLKIVPNDPYVTNYLAYSWLERNYKIEESLDMLQEAYEQKKNDPYIIDSIGWANYLIKDYQKAEKYLLRALELMPNDPIVNDHYGDILWMLNRKIQARYFWNNALKQEDTEKEMKKKIEEKLLNGISNL
tara:strand:+ start:4720 stop:6411 length:1692 start_codon:yes stop_codon:yes gene_type:complete